MTKVVNTRRHFVVYFEPMDVCADSYEDAKDRAYVKMCSGEHPEISKVILEQYSLDVNVEEGHRCD